MNAVDIPVSARDDIALSNAQYVFIALMWDTWYARAVQYASLLGVRRDDWLEIRPLTPLTKTVQHPKSWTDLARTNHMLFLTLIKMHMPSYIVFGVR